MIWIAHCHLMFLKFSDLEFAKLAFCAKFHVCFAGCFMAMFGCLTMGFAVPD